MSVDLRSESVASRLHWQLLRDPQRIVLRLVSADSSVRDVSATELASRAQAYARVFRELDTRGQVVGVCLYHGRELYAAFIGALWAGAIPTMVPPPSPRIERAKYIRSFQHIAEYIKPAVLIVDGEALAALSELQLDRVRMPELVTPDQVADIAGDAAAAEPEPFITAPDDVILIQHSSGTTGLQKGVALSNRAVLAHNAAYGQAIGLTSSDVIASWLPLYHDMGFIACFLMPLLEGVEIVAMSPFDWVRRPMMLLEQMHRHRATFCWLPNFAFAVIANARTTSEAIDAIDLTGVRAFINSSEPVTSGAMRQFVDRFGHIGATDEKLAACYAMAENVYAVTQSEFGNKRVLTIDAKQFRESHRAAPAVGASTDILTFVSNGRPMAGTDVRVRVAGRTADEGETGEIELRGAFLFSGYFRKPDVTAAVMTDDGWYRTGDLGFLFDGELYVTGRLKDLIIVQGRNFYPADIERASEVAGVTPGRVVAFGMSDPRAGTEGIVILAEAQGSELQGGDARAPHDIIGEIRRTIAQEFDCTPSVVKIVADRWLVKSSSGKLARNENREKYLAELKNQDAQ